MELDKLTFGLVIQVLDISASRLIGFLVIGVIKAIVLIMLSWCCSWGRLFRTYFIIATLHVVGIIVIHCR